MVMPWCTQTGDRELVTLWSELQVKMDGLFQGEDILPSLCVGDLGSDNAGEADSGPGGAIIHHYVTVN